jgi:hypothetical protein
LQAPGSTRNQPRVAAAPVVLEAEREVEHVAGLVAELQVRARRPGQAKRRHQSQNEARSHEAPRIAVIYR